MTASTPKLPGLTREPQRHPDCCLSLSKQLLSVIVDAVLANLPTSSIATTKPKIILSIGSGSGLLEACLQRHIDSLKHNNSQSGPKLGTELREGIKFQVEGVEVHQLPSSSSSSTLPKSSLNRYLPEDRKSTVRGTWEVSPRLFSAAASETMGGNKQHDPELEFDRIRTQRKDDEDGDDGGQVVALMFVYPRLPALVAKYMDAISSVTPATSISSPSSFSSTQHTSRVNTIIYLGPKADWSDFSPCFMRLAGSPTVTTFPLIKVYEGGEAGLLDYEMMGVISFTLF